MGNGKFDPHNRMGVYELFFLYDTYESPLQLRARQLEIIEKFDIEVFEYRTYS